MSIYSIYKATNIYNGKSYIGFAARWPARKTEHLNESYREKSACYHTHFHRAIRKYGFDAFVWEIIFNLKMENTRCNKWNHISYNYTIHF
jgi:hypothetical protein